MLFPNVWWLLGCGDSSCKEVVGPLILVRTVVNLACVLLESFCSSGKTVLEVPNLDCHCHPHIGASWWGLVTIKLVQNVSLDLLARRTWRKYMIYVRSCKLMDICSNRFGIEAGWICSDDDNVLGWKRRSWQERQMEFCNSTYFLLCILNKGCFFPTTAKNWNSILKASYSNCSSFFLSIRASALQAFFLYNFGHSDWLVFCSFHKCSTAPSVAHDLKF